MKSYIAFTKKEFLEYYRTSKLIVMGVVFLLLGILNPATAKLTPELLKMINTQGVEIKIPEPGAMDSWTQFYKNVPQIGIIVMVIFFCSLFASEFSKGTLIHILTKGMKRSTVIAAKFTMASCLWTACYWLTYAVTYVYTIYFWPKETTQHIFFAAFCLWLFGIFMIAVVITGGIVLKGVGGCLLFTGGVYVVLMLLQMIPHVAEYNPVQLTSVNMDFITGKREVTEILKALVVTLVMIAGMLTGSCWLFNKKSL